MAPSPDFEALYLESQRMLEEEQRRREEEQRRREEEQRRREEAEAETRSTTLSEFLNGCHSHLHLNLSIQKDPTQSTKGDPTNAHNKVRPEELRFWHDFAEEQAKIWALLNDSELPQHRLFPSIHSLESMGKHTIRQSLGSESDLSLFLQSSVENPIKDVIESLFQTPQFRQKFCLRGDVKFENHANTLSPELNENRPASRSIETGLPANTRSNWPRADRFCVYDTKYGLPEQRIPVILFELKAPHKFPLDCINEGLGDMDLADVVHVPTNDSSLLQSRRVVAAVITQAFSYMVEAGVELGCVCSGEAFIFLRVPEDPSKVEYYLAVPRDNVGETTGWTRAGDTENRLHLTAVGQMLAFTLRALRTTPRSREWRQSALSRLKLWELEYEEIPETVIPDEAPSSEYRPPREHRNIRLSPIQLRFRARPSSMSGCSPPLKRTKRSDDESDQDTPNRPPQQFPRGETAGAVDQSAKPVDQSAETVDQSAETVDQTAKEIDWIALADPIRTANQRRTALAWEYCTQKCLLGLVKGGKLDKSCPNTSSHGEGWHALTVDGFLDGIYRQMHDNRDEGCLQVGHPGSRGVQFKVRLLSHGYTVAAKGTVIHFIPHLEHEASIYNALASIQGKHVPVYLGSIRLEWPWYYDGLARIWHMMFLGFGGRSISGTEADLATLQQKVEVAMTAVHKCGVLQCDAEVRNLLWNDGQVMVIDFERAKQIEHRSVLKITSPNRKRKRPDDDREKPGKNSSKFSHELRQASASVHRQCEASSREAQVQRRYAKKRDSQQHPPTHPCY